MSTASFTSVVRFIVLPLGVLLAHDPNLLNTNMSPFFTTKCPSNGQNLCGISPPIESHSAVSHGQCIIACNYVTGCKWVNFVVDDISNTNGGRGLCHVFNKPPQVGIRSKCTLYSSDKTPPQMNTSPDYMGILVQQHYNGSTFFQRTWNEFKAGFGDVNSNYWIGNDQLHSLTSGGKYRLRVDLQGRDDCQWYWAEYSTFIVGSEASKFKLTIDGFSGTAPDAMNDGTPSHRANGMMFSTKDANNGGCASYINCADKCGGGFWHNCCTPSYINTPSNCPDYDSFTWNRLKLQYSRLTLV